MHIMFNMAAYAQFKHLIDEVGEGEGNLRHVGDDHQEGEQNGEPGERGADCPAHAPPGNKRNIRCSNSVEDGIIVKLNAAIEESAGLA